jgi:hypothetical protein
MRVDSAGGYRIAAADDDLFFRVTKLIVTSSYVSVESGPNAVAAPGETVTHDFSVSNLGTSERTFDLSATSSTGWADLSTLPASVTILAGDSHTVSIPVIVPADAVSGDSDTLTLTALAQDDASVFDSASTETLAWVGPVLSGLSTNVVHRGDKLVLSGRGFGSDPGPDNRGSATNNVTLGGRIVPTSLVTAWSDTTIQLMVPSDATSGQVFVVAAGTASNELEINVINQPLACAGAVPSVDLLWPANHNFVPIDVLSVTDPDGDAVTITIDSIFQDEAVDAKGSGNTAPDGQGVSTSTAEVRAERVGSGDGRVYHIGFTADDGTGGSCSGEVTVGVPHDQGKGSVPVDEGALYDSTVIP